MVDFTITERTEPFTLNEVFEFIDDTNISKLDACELKSRIVDAIQAERDKVIDKIVEQLEEKGDLIHLIDNSQCIRVDKAIEIVRGGVRSND